MSAGSCFDSQNERTTRIRAMRSLLVQLGSAGVGSRRARSRVNAGVVWCPGCRRLIGHFIGRVLRDTLHADASEAPLCRQSAR